jgi:hypothetical protein
MSENEEDRERTSMDVDEGTPEDDLLRREEEAARREAAGIGGRRPQYENEEGLPADESERVVEEGGEGFEEGFEVAEEDLVEAASHGENRYDPSTADFGDDESAGDADVLDAEPDQVDVTETVRDPDAGPGEDPGEGPGISHDR